MYENRDLVRTTKLRMYINENERDEVKEGANAAGMEPSVFVRSSALCMARLFRAMEGKNISFASLEARLARLTDDIRYSFS